MMRNNNKDDLVILLLNFFEHPFLKERKYKLKEIKKIFSYNYNASLEDIKDGLWYLERYGFIYNYSDGSYGLLDNDDTLCQGIIRINKTGEAYLNGNGFTCKIDKNDLNGALDGDNVVVKISGFVKDNEKKLRARDGVVDGNIIVNSVTLNALGDGDRIIVKVDKKKNNGVYYAGYIKYLNHKSEPDSDLKVIASEFSIRVDFSKAALADAELIPNEVIGEDLIGRKDLTDELIFTIYSSETKDRDDAISLKKDENGNYLLGVHIADVSHYVKPESALWEEAKNRSTSVYMANTVIPMLPYKLSNGICSLNPGSLRLTFSCFVTLSPKGDILNYKFVESYIKSRKSLTFGEVNEVICNGVISDDMMEYAETLLEMNRLSNILQKKKIKRGFTNFGCNDVKVVVDEDGMPLDFIPRTLSNAEQIIENFMLTVGECSADFVKGPAPFRVHDCPDDESINRSLENLKKSGIKVKCTQKITDAKRIQDLLLQIKDIDERDLAANIILRSMKRAGYSTNNVGHFGLSLKKYAHFTSPIRRFPDLLMHYLIKKQVNRKNSFKLIKTQELEKICNYATDKEYKADSAEHEALLFVMAKYIDMHIGEKFNAIVTYVNSSGILVKTSNGIEGKLDPLDIEDEDFYYDSKARAFIGKNTKIRITIGTQLELVAVDTKREYRTINFGLNSEDLMQLKKIKNDL